MYLLRWDTNLDSDNLPPKVKKEHNQFSGGKKKNQDTSARKHIVTLTMEYHRRKCLIDERSKVNLHTSWTWQDNLSVH